MTSPLECLAGPGQSLAAEPPDVKEFDSLQVLSDTLGLGPEVWRVLSKSHDLRNRTEYEGAFEVDERLLRDLITAGSLVLSGLPLKL